MLSHVVNGESERRLTKQERHLLRKEEKRRERERRARKRAAKKLAIWLVIAFFVVAAIVGATQLGAGGESKDGTAGTDLNITETDNNKGNPDAAVTLVEYSDFQCPACATFFPVVKSITDEFGDTLRFVYRHFPLSQHRHASLAARAAEAAGAQGKFWEMHDLLFERQRVWSVERNPRSTFTSYAKELGIDLARFEKDLDSREALRKVDSDLRSAARAGVNSTPSFFLNGRRIRPQSAQEFNTVITAALRAISAGNMNVAEGGAAEETSPQSTSTTAQGVPTDTLPPPLAEPPRALELDGGATE